MKKRVSAVQTTDCHRTWGLGLCTFSCPKYLSQDKLNLQRRQNSAKRAAGLTKILLFICETLNKDLKKF